MGMANSCFFKDIFQTQRRQARTGEGEKKITKKSQPIEKIETKVSSFPSQLGSFVSLHDCEKKKKKKNEKRQTDMAEGEHRRGPNGGCCCFYQLMSLFLFITNRYRPISENRLISRHGQRKKKNLHYAMHLVKNKFFKRDA